MNSAPAFFLLKEKVMKFQVPSTQYLLNMAIGLAIIATILKFVPERYKAYFRI